MYLSHNIRILFAFMFFLSFQAAVKAQTAEYLWPTEASPYLTSTFGETRSAHFHAGLDIKTWGREGYEVYATRSGKLHRIAIGPGGYGKVIYIEHNDGTFSLYAHLQRFAPRFQKIADPTRLKNFSFEIDTVFNEETIPVQKGEIVGYSGSTGVGPPHLHFELRDLQQRPFNALKTGLEVRDELPPVFSELLVEPLEPGRFPQTKKPAGITTDSTNTKTYHFGTLEVQGAVGMALDVYDEVSQVTNKYAAYELIMLHESDTLFHSRLDYFSYDVDEQMFIDRAAAPGSTRKRFQRLYLKDGNTLPFYIKAEKSHDIPFRTGQFTFIAKDYFGNTSMAILHIEKKSEQSRNGPGNDVECLVSVENDCYWTENWVSTPQNTFINLTKLTDYPHVSSTHFSGNSKQIHLTGSDYTHKILRLNPSHPLKATISRHTTLYLPEGSVFDTLSVSVSADDTGIVILPEQAPIRSSYAVAHYLENTTAPVQSYGFYELDRADNEYNYIESKLKGNTLWAYPRKTGIFVFKADTTPPVAHDPTIRKTGTLKVISVTAEDGLSGIDYKKSFIFVNGQQGIMEYEPEDNRISFYHPRFVLKNTNFVELQLSDKAGNKATFNFIVEK